jgi:hypothetical protein
VHQQLGDLSKPILCVAIAKPLLALRFLLHNLGFEVSSPILSIIPEQITSLLGMSINWYFMEELPEFIITIFIKHIIKKLKY